MRKPSITTLAVTGMLAALVTLATLLLKLPVPIAQGYVHLGDALILLAALLIGPLAAPVGAVGSALADVVSGYGLYVLPTFFIKAAVGYLAGRLCARRGFRLVPVGLAFTAAELVMVLGYALFEGWALGWATALADLLPNAVQAVFSVALGCALLPIARRIAPALRPGGKPL